MVAFSSWWVGACGMWAVRLEGDESVDGPHGARGRGRACIRWGGGVHGCLGGSEPLGLARLGVVGKVANSDGGLGA